jgi:hypothetical protein
VDFFPLDKSFRSEPLHIQFKSTSMLFVSVALLSSDHHEPVDEYYLVLLKFDIPE